LLPLPPGNVPLPPPVNAVPAVGALKVMLPLPELPLRVAVSLRVFTTQPAIAPQFTSVLPKSRDAGLNKKFAATAGGPSNANRATNEAAETSECFIPNANARFLPQKRYKIITAASGGTLHSTSCARRATAIDPYKLLRQELRTGLPLFGYQHEAKIQPGWCCR
jgi:hypothetical protein